MAPTQVYTFKHNAVPNDPKASGRAVVRAIDASTSETTLTLTGLTPNKAYAAHYHALGPQANADPCMTNGPVTLGFPPFTASAAGRATVKLTAPTSKVAGNAGAYINVHAADDLNVIPLCAAIRQTNPGTLTSPAPKKVASVMIADNLFQPATLTVEVGTTVTWKHQGAAVHNVISLADPSLHSSDLGKGESYSYTFNKAGTYAYYCSYHEGMNGTIIVNDEKGRK
ncbi:hypothetical protein GCM10025871_05240 [Deinococcus metallilatus]|nr:hypothetical protein GCM10025871_05240 [Deinococcus metallilatus]